MTEKIRRKLQTIARGPSSLRAAVAGHALSSHDARRFFENIDRFPEDYPQPDFLMFVERARMFFDKHYRDISDALAEMSAV